MVMMAAWYTRWIHAPEEEHEANGFDRTTGQARRFGIALEAYDSFSARVLILHDFHLINVSTAFLSPLPASADGDGIAGVPKHQMTS